MNLTNLFELAKDAANQAGTFLNTNKNVTKQIITDEGRDIKLELDRKTEELINEILAKSKIPVMGEELSSNFSSDFFWVVDPIDGTANYFRGLDQCCISIGLMKNDEAVLGVIYNFNTNEMFAALKGKGAFLNDKKIEVSKIQKKDWSKEIPLYFERRVNLVHVLIFTDARHPMRESDIHMVEMLEQLNIPYSIILTKSDKLTLDEKKKTILNLESIFAYSMLISTKDQASIAKLRSYISELLSS